MPPNNTIVARLTADPRDMQRGFSAGGQAAETFAQQLARVDRQTQMLGRSGGPGGAGTTRFAQGFLELSRGIEDANVGFQLQGLQGAVRGSMNNLAAFATMLGGPIIGAVTTFAAVGLSSLVSWFSKTDTATNDSRESMERYGESVRKFIDGQLDAVRASQELADVLSSKQAVSRIDDLQKRLELNRAEASAISQLGNGQTQDQLRRQYDLTQQRLFIEKQIEDTRRKQVELTEQEANEIARKQFIADTRLRRRDAESALAIVSQQMRGVSPGLADEFQKSLQIRELRNLNIDPRLQDALAGFIGGNPEGETSSATFVKAGTQQAAALQQQDAARARQEERQREQIEILKEIRRELERQRDDNTPVNESINLD